MHQTIANPERRLLLTNRALANRAARLFAELGNDQDLRDAFIDAPAEIIGKEILGQEFTPAQTSAVNRFIYSVLSNEGLQRWVSEYDTADPAEGLAVPSRQQRIADVANAFVKHGDQALMASLLDMSTAGVRIPGADAASLILKTESIAIGNWFIYKVAGRVFGDDVLVLPASQVEAIATSLLKRARELKDSGVLADMNQEIR